MSSVLARLPALLALLAAVAAAIFPAFAQSPFPEPSAEPLLRSERFFYDGVRRIQEVRIDPLVQVDQGPGSVGGGSGGGDAPGNRLTWAKGLFRHGAASARRGLAMIPSAA